MEHQNPNKLQLMKFTEVLGECFSLAFLDDLLTGGCKNNLIKGHNVGLKKSPLIYSIIRLPPIALPPELSLRAPRKHLVFFIISQTGSLVLLEAHRLALYGPFIAAKIVKTGG